MPLPKSWSWRGQNRHLVAELVDGDNQLVVYKYWLKSKQRWAYVTEERYLIEYELRLLARPDDG